MSVWAPATGEVDPFRAAVLQAARYLLTPDSVRPLGRREADGWRRVALPDGRRAAIALEQRLRPERYWGSRAAICYDLTGRATLEREGFTIEGHAVIDSATRAFLALDVQLRTMGRLDR